MNIANNITRLNTAKSDLKAAINAQLDSDQTKITNELVSDYAPFVTSIRKGTPQPPEPTPTSMSYFEANGTELTKYTGSLSEIVIPKSYSKTETIIATVTGALVNPNRIKTGSIYTGIQTLNLTFTDGTTTMTAQIGSSYINYMEDLETFFTTYFSTTPALVSATPSGSAFFPPYAMETLLNMCQQYGFLSFPINIYDTYNYQSQTFTTVDDMYYYINSNNNSNLAFDFTDTTVLKEVTFSDGNDYQITSIGNNVFKGNTSLTKVTILSNILTIGVNAFNKCSNLVTFEMYDGCTTLTNDTGNYEGLFYQCSKLKNVTLSNYITALPQCCFTQCSELAELTLPSALTTINYAAFANCSKLLRLYIPKNVSTIDRAFTGCLSLLELSVDSENTTYDSRNDCNCIVKKSNNQIIAGGGWATIPNTVTSIGANAFQQRMNLVSLTIPSSVTSIGQEAFANCRRLGTITIPNSVTSMGTSVFSNCMNLSSATIGTGMTSIPGSLFYNCVNLSTVTLNEAVTSIGNYTFQECTKLSSFTLPSGISAISNGLFSGCSALKSITIPSNVTSIGSNAFKGCTSLSEITISSNITSIGASAFEGCTNFITVDIPSSVTSIGNTTFKGCTRLATANIYATSSTTKISSYSNAWFNGCSSSLVLHIPSSVTTPTTAYGTYWNYYASGSTLTYYADLS